MGFQGQYDVMIIYSYLKSTIKLHYLLLTHTRCKASQTILTLQTILTTKLVNLSQKQDKNMKKPQKNTTTTQKQHRNNTKHNKQPHT